MDRPRHDVKEPQMNGQIDIITYAFISNLMNEDKQKKSRNSSK